MVRDGGRPGVGDEGLARLRWGLSRYRMAVAAVIGAVTALVVLTTQQLGGPEPYEARALVVARQLTVNAEQLPQFGEAIFNSPSVSRLAVEAAGLDVDPEELVPDRVALAPVEESVLFEVIAVDDDPEMAATLANATTSAFVAELNKPGEGVGDFAVQSPAQLPSDRRAAPVSLAQSVVGGLLAGTAAAVGGVWLWLLLRPPVMSGPAAARLAGTSLVGTVALPRRRAGEADLAEVRGLRLTARRLFPFRDGTLAFLAVRRGEAAGHDVVRLVARLVERHALLTVVAGDEFERPMAIGRGEPTVAGDRALVPAVDGSPGITLIDGCSLGGAHDLPEFLPADARLLLVVHDGAATADVAEAADQFLPGELDGVIFVRRARRRRWTRRRPSAETAEAHAEPLAG